ncbi:methylenetetrahydrofolate reductase (NADPH) [Trypanosoma grayi]|uniref:methylenetetrahydrofolate reductase (NADPH) n=1 Tax=Trypanosoma grayi TaxID=71804 RepID=UPI0004F4AFCE|nr:methylenetetrahydrofolate reductase (NADPH) [Trypanosoma grayi]KEG13870.1 methylenetetrahydrofolate reductase (NADPH) [Trypanosoma grayi]
MSVRHVADLLAEEKDEGRHYYSFEFLPPRTEKGEEKLWDLHFPRFAKMEPLFVDITWGAGGQTSSTTLRISKDFQEKYGVPVNMHLTCANMHPGLLKETLDSCYKCGIRNILALRGDPPNGTEWKPRDGELTCALDLVKFIRANYGDFFCISVAGYPEGHPSAINTVAGRITEDGMKKELDYLKAKVDAGASLVITQIFYDADLFIEFVKKCRAHGITVPILPGILPISTYRSLKRIVNLCKTYLPPEVAARVEELKDDEEGLKKYGISQAVKMVWAIQSADINIKHFHLYVVNAPDSILGVMNELGV